MPGWLRRGRDVSLILFPRGAWFSGGRADAGAAARARGETHSHDFSLCVPMHAAYRDRVQRLVVVRCHRGSLPPKTPGVRETEAREQGMEYACRLLNQTHSADCFSPSVFRLPRRR